MTSFESEYASQARRIEQETNNNSSPEKQNLEFAMKANGYSYGVKTWGLREGWNFDSNFGKIATAEFRSQAVTFFGPNPNDTLFRAKETNVDLLAEAMSLASVSKVMSKYRDIDSEVAIRIAFILGGNIRHLNLTEKRDKQILDIVDFIARNTLLGGRRSGVAIATAMTMYVISGGSLKDDPVFREKIFHMSEALEANPVRPKTTEDLGLSQVTTLKHFHEGILPKDIDPYRIALSGFPTVGAEFHLPLSTTTNNPDLWWKLALLNMSQHNSRSYVQFSRNDRGVIEIRMNPSSYPVTIANWEHLRMIVPELDSAFFTVTVNRNNSEGNFNWGNSKDKDLLRALQTLGMFSYAASFKNRPVDGSREEIGFGAMYLGQTFRFIEGKSQFDGNWGGGEGDYGQLGIYAGYRDNLPPLAYFLSMGLANPSLLRVFSEYPDLSNVATLEQALNIPPLRIRQAFADFQGNVRRDYRLSTASDAGLEIMDLLSPR